MVGEAVKRAAVLCLAVLEQNGHLRAYDRCKTLTLWLSPVSTASAPEQRVQLVQFPRVCEATDPRCLSRKRRGRGSAQGPGADPEGAKGAADDEGMRGQGRIIAAASADQMLTAHGRDKQSSDSSTSWTG